MTKPMDTGDFSETIRALDVLLRRLYHWAKRVHEEPAPSDGVAKHMLELSTAELHQFIATLVDCLTPIHLAPTPVPIGDVIASLVQQARLVLRAPSVTIVGEARGVVKADAAQLARAWPGILRRLGLQATGRGVLVKVSAVPRRVEIALAPADGGRPSALHEPTAEVEWTLARRIVALHGGEVRERAGEPGVRLLFPVEGGGAGA